MKIRKYLCRMTRRKKLAREIQQKSKQKASEKASSTVHYDRRVPEDNMAGILINDVTSGRRAVDGAPAAAEICARVMNMDDE